MRKPDRIPVGERRESLYLRRHRGFRRGAKKDSSAAQAPCADDDRTGHLTNGTEIRPFRRRG